VAKNPKRPRDPNQLAKLMLDITTGELPNDSPRPGPEPQETAWRRKGGRKGAKARAKKLSAKRRTAIAQKAARARWRRP
jgi:hypothetical protein